MAMRHFIKKYIATPGVKKWFFNQSGYNKYGLYRDDMLCETPEVEEAVRRLPQKLYDERVYRLIRASQLFANHNILPQNEWTKFEDDENHRYLMPYLEEVEREVKERKLWAKAH